MEAVVTGAPHAHHGHQVTLADVKPRLKAICEDKRITSASPPGTCAHGVGHAILILSSYDLGEALKHCWAFESTPLAHYCATGVFMEHETRPVASGRKSGSLHYPCDTYTEFPAACYKYALRRHVVRHKWNVESISEECLALEAPLRRGCFYGLGGVQLSVLLKQPDRLASVCSFGDSQDQAMCINGAIEVLSHGRPDIARTACAALTGDRATVCQAAARNGLYGLDKTFSLYAQQ